MRTSNDKAQLFGVTKLPLLFLLDGKHEPECQTRLGEKLTASNHGLQSSVRPTERSLKASRILAALASATNWNARKGLELHEMLIAVWKACSLYLAKRKWQQQSTPVSVALSDGIWQWCNLYYKTNIFFLFLRKEKNLDIL